MRKTFLSILFLSLIVFAWAQNKKVTSASLEKQRNNLLAEIAQTEKELNALQKDKSSSLEALKVLQKKLETRNKLVAHIDREVQLLNKGIQETNTDITVLRNDLKGLKKQYAELVRFSYKNRTSENFILFLFSAKSFNDANRRLEYVKAYRNFRADQAKKIELTSLALEKKANYLLNQRSTKDAALNDQKKQNAALEKETDLQNKMVNDLKGKEGELTKKLAIKRKTAADLNNAIAAAIQKEVQLAQQRAMAEQLKKKREELALKEAQRKEAAALAAKKEEENKLAEAKKQRELELQRLAEEKRKREEAATKLIEENKKRLEEEKALAEAKRKREQEERKARAMAEKERKEREAELARQKQEQENQAVALQKEKDRQESLKLQLEEERKKQKDYEERLAKEEVKREKERKLKEAEREANAKKGGKFKNPRYIPSQAEVEKEAKREEEAKRLAKAEISSNYSIALTEAERNLSNNFEANQGRLPWPVSTGYVSEHFGKNKHPVFNIYTENYGIDIRTDKGQAAYAIFPGEVSSVIYIPGAGQTVLVNHGSFYTVYSKLANVKVSKGNKVNLKQVIGNVMTDESGATNIHFEIWKIGNDGSPYKVNPESWVRKP